MKFLILLTSIVLFVGGCASLQLAQSTTQPITPQQRLDAAQTDLTEAYKVATALHDFGTLSDQQWTIIQNAYPVAQKAIDLAGVAVGGNMPDALDLLDEAAKAVKLFKTHTK